MSVYSSICGRRGARLAVVLLAAAGISRAAQPFSESFETSPAGWTNSGQWESFAVTNGRLQGRFAALGGPPAPQTGRFIATNSTSGGAFVGDYAAAGIEQIGFSVLAADTLPSELLLRWYGGDGFVYFRGGLATNLTATGVWHTLTFSLRGKDEGGWIGSSATNFDAARQAVTWVEIAVSRNGSAAQHFAVDNIFVDAIPAVTAFSADVAPPRLIISPLRTNAAYRVQAAATPSGTWTNLDVLIATNRAMPWPIPDPAAHTARFFRVAQDGVTH